MERTSTEGRDHQCHAPMRFTRLRESGQLHSCESKPKSHSQSPVAVAEDSSHSAFLTVVLTFARVELLLEVVYLGCSSVGNSKVDSMLVDSGGRLHTFKVPRRLGLGLVGVSRVRMDIQHTPNRGAWR